MYYVQEEGHLLIADCEDHENLVASDFHVKRFKHQEVAEAEGKLIFPCADGSLKLFDVRQNPARRNARQGKPRAR